MVTEIVSELNSWRWRQQWSRSRSVVDFFSFEMPPVQRMREKEKQTLPDFPRKRLPNNTERSAEKDGADKKGRKETSTRVLKSWNAIVAASLAALGPGQRSSWPSVAFFTSSPDFRHSACRALLFVSRPSEARGAHLPAHACCVLQWPMSKSSASSRVQWQGSTRWKQDWSGSWKGWDDSWATTSPISEQISDEHVMATLHAMLDHCSISQKFPKGAHKKRSLSNPSQEQRPTSSERRGGPYQSTRKTGRDEAPLSAEVGRGVRGRDVVQRHHKDLEKAEVLERRAKTVTNADGGFDDHGGRRLQDAPRPSRRSKETRERALSAVKSAKHHYPLHILKIAQRRTR